MRKLSLIVLALASGCWGNGGYYANGGRGSDDTYRSFDVESGCTLVSTVALSGSPATWDGCRLRYDENAQVYTWQFTTPGTTGTWDGQAPGWFTLAFNLNSPQDARLTLSPLAGTEPGSVPLHQVVFSYAPTTDANVGGVGFIDVDANIVYPGGPQSALDAHLSIDVPGVGTFSGEASATIGDVLDAGITDLAIARDATVLPDASEID